MLKKALGVIAIVMVLSGCGMQVRQDGNKIYTDISRDEAYGFTSAALKTKGYKVTEESKTNYYIKATPESNKTFQIDKADKKELSATIADNGPRETVVTVIAIANGDIDQPESNRIAAEAVKEIIAELDLYGKFTASKDGSNTYPAATAERINEYIKTYFTQNNLTAAKNNGVLTVKETAALNPFNEPLNADITVAGGETGKKVTVTVKATIKGNYDVKGNQVYVEKFVKKFLDFLAEYPAVEKTTHFVYNYIGSDKAFDNAKSALKDVRCIIVDLDPHQYVLTAKKNNINLSLTFTKTNNNLAVDITAFAEGAVNETKDQLTQRVTVVLNSIQEALGRYQIVLTTNKLFTTNNQEDVVNYIQTALKNLSYKGNYNANDKTFMATKTTDFNRSHFLVINNNIGDEDINAEIYTIYNTKSDNAEAIARREQSALLAALNLYDGQGMK